MQLGLEVSVVSPCRVHVIILIICLELFHLLLLLVVESEHLLVCLLIDGGLLDWSTRTLLLEFDNELRFLILSEKLTKHLLWLTLFRADPESSVSIFKIISDAWFLLPLFLILQDHPDWLILTQAIVARVRHHHQTPNDVQLLLQHLHSQCHLPINLRLMHQLFSLHTLLKHLFAEFFRDEPASTEMVFVNDFTAAGLWRHFFQTINYGQILMLHIIV